MQEKLNYSLFLKNNHGDSPGLIAVLAALSNAAVRISEKLAHLPASDSITTQRTNLHGEVQHEIDQYSEKEFLRALSESCSCFAVLSEEQEAYIQISNASAREARFIVALDPLDGSSNIDVNIPVGSIFSVYDRFKSSSPNYTEAVMQDARCQIAAGYFLYGAATMLVLACGEQVNGFTLNRQLNGFFLSHPDIHIPETGKTYSLNDGNYHQFDRATQHYIRYCRQQAEFHKQPFSARYVGSLVADIHRTLLHGGIFLYPETSAAPGGKLRLAYECRPMAYIVEQAGGLAYSGSRHVLELELLHPHQRVPILIGSAEMVKTAQYFLNPSLPLACEQSLQS